jgi:hypothetical protein
MAHDPAAESKEPTAITTTAPFGPGFFLGQLGAFARARCPDPAEALPLVELHLATGEVLDLCHVMGLAPAFVALAVRDGPRSGTGEARMRTDLVPYSLITRVTIRPASAAGTHVGFDVHHAPDILAQGGSPEEVLRAAASPVAEPSQHGERQRP